MRVVCYAAAAALCLAVPAANADELKSGPEGKIGGAFQVKAITGEKKGDTLCYVCKFGGESRPGVVLIGEGPRSRTQPMLEKERVAVARLLPNVPLHLIYVGPDTDAVPLHKISGKLNRLPRKLTKAEVIQVEKRLTSVAKVKGFKIPGGIDPMRMRAPRPR